MFKKIGVWWISGPLIGESFPYIFSRFREKSQRRLMTSWTMKVETFLVFSHDFERKYGAIFASVLDPVTNNSPLSGRVFSLSHKKTVFSWKKMHFEWSLSPPREMARNGSSENKYHFKNVKELLHIGWCKMAVAQILCSLTPPKKNRSLDLTEFVSHKKCVRYPNTLKRDTLRW